VHFFLSSASSGDKEIACRCLDLVKFGMANTIVSFKDQNWIYGRDAKVTIGGFESAFFADLVAAYILEISTELSSNSICYGIY